MNESNKAKILDKIKKLMALSKSGNSHEAANALKKAQAYMREHNISDDDVDLMDCEEGLFTLTTQKPPQWILQLINLVGDVFGCEPALSWDHTVCPPKRAVLYVGIGPNAQLASYCFDVLHVQLRKDRQTFVRNQPKQCKPKTKRLRGDAYAEHWCHAVRGKVQKLVVCDNHQALIKRYMHERVYEGAEPKSYTPGGQPKGNKFNHARAAGWLDGKRANLHNPVTGQGQGKLEHHVH